MAPRLQLVSGIAILTFAAACHPSRPKLPELPAAFANLPTPPNAQFIGRSGGADVLMLTFSSPLEPDSVVNYYRQMFTRDTIYHLLGDNKGATGEEAFYVESSKRPMWVRVRPNAGGVGSVVELTGAVVGPADTASGGAAGAR